MDTFTGFAIGKPVVIEETFLLKCSPNELEECIDGSKKHASGWIGEAPALQWLEHFQRKANR